MVEISRTERRKHNRVSCNVDVGYTSEEMFGHDYITDISLGGVFIETFETFVPGRQIRLAIPFSKEEKYVKVTGRVVRIADNGVGVAFTER